MNIENLPESEQALSEIMMDEIADNLVDKGYVILADFLPNRLANSLLKEAKVLSRQAFKQARIGRNQDQQINPQVRTDSILWLDYASACQLQYLDFMERLRKGLNSRLFMGLFDFECHYSHYKKGDFYHTHLDAFKGQSNRVLSTVYYLNHNWAPADGGELVLYNQQQSSLLESIAPVFNQCVIFLSDSFPHRVLISHKNRFSIAGWFRVNGSVQGQLDPPI